MFSHIIYTAIKLSFSLVSIILGIVIVKIYFDLKKTNSHKNNQRLNILIISWSIITVLALSQLEKDRPPKYNYDKEEAMFQEKLKLDELNRIKNTKK